MKMRILIWIMSIAAMLAAIAWIKMAPGNLLIVIGVALLFKVLKWRKNN